MIAKYLPFTNADARDNFEAEPTACGIIAGMSDDDVMEWAEECAHILSISTGQTWQVAHDFDLDRCRADADEVAA